MRPTFLGRSRPNRGRKIAPKSNELTDFEKPSVLWTIYTNFWQACWNSISPAAVLLLELERLYESFRKIKLPQQLKIIDDIGGEARSRAEPPAGHNEYIPG